MLEIYNEEYKDLLGKTLPAGKKHQVSSTSLMAVELCCLFAIYCNEKSSVAQVLLHTSESARHYYSDLLDCCGPAPDNALQQQPVCNNNMALA